MLYCLLVSEMPPNPHPFGPVRQQRAQRRQEVGAARGWLRRRGQTTPALRAMLDLLANIRCEQTTTDDTWPAMQAVLQMILLMCGAPNRRGSAFVAEVNRLILRVIAHPAPIPIAFGAELAADIANHDRDVVL